MLPARILFPAVHLSHGQEADVDSVAPRSERLPCRRGGRGLVVIVLSEPPTLRVGEPGLVQSQVFLASTEPIQDLRSPEAGVFLGQENPIGGVLPVAEVLHEAVFLRILVDIGDHIPELAVAGDRHAAEGVLEQAPMPAIGGIDGLGVGVEEIREFSTGIVRS